MKHPLAGLVLMAAVGVLVAQAPQPKGPAKQPAKKGPVADPAPTVPVIRFNPSAVAVAGVPASSADLAASADGTRVACVGGAFAPTSGFLTVIDVPTRKEVLALRLPRMAQSVGLSPDGKVAACTGQSGELRVVQVETGKTLFFKKLDSAAIVAFAPDGQSLATATQAKTVQLWDAATGEELSRFRGASAQLRGIAFSPDGRKLAAAGAEQQQRMNGQFSGSLHIDIWDVVTLRLVRRLELTVTNPVNTPTLAFSPDSTAVACASTVQVHIWDVASEKLKQTISTQQQIFGLAFGSKAIAVGLGDGSVAVFDAATGDEIALMSRHNGTCNGVAFIDGGKKVVSCGGNQSVKVWDVAEKKEIATLHEHRDADDAATPVAMAATADGALVAVATEDRAIVLHDGRTGTVTAILRGHDDVVTRLVISPDGKTLASASADKTIKLWDVAAGKERATLRGHTNWVHALAFSHDGKTLASGGYDRTVRLWDVATGRQTGAIEAHRGAVRAVAFAPNDRELATGGSDRDIRLWEIGDGEFETKYLLLGHEGTVRSLMFSPSGKVLASGGEDGAVKFWDPTTGKESVASKGKHNQMVTSLAFAGERTVVSGGSDGTINQWDSLTGTLMNALQGHNGAIAGLAVSAAGTELLSAGADGILKRFSSDLEGPVRIFAGHTGDIHCVSFSPDGARFVSCGNWPEGDKTVRIWDVQKGTELLKIDQPGQAAMALYSPDGKFLVSTCGNGKAYLWEAASGKQLREFKGHNGEVVGLAFNADGSRILTSGADKTARLWEVASGRELTKFTNHTDFIRRVAFHPDGKHALSAGRDGLVRMWELATAKEVKQFKSSGKWADSMDVSKDGRFLAIGGQTVLVYDLATGNVLSECVGHKFGITSVAFSNDGQRLLTGAYDGTARLWDRETGKEVYRFKGHREFLFMASFSPDNRWVLTGGGGLNAGNGKYEKGTDLAVRLWRMPDDRALAEFAESNAN